MNLFVLVTGHIATLEIIYQIPGTSLSGGLSMCPLRKLLDEFGVTPGRFFYYTTNPKGGNL